MWTLSITAVLVALAADPRLPTSPAAVPTPQHPRRAIERALAFLQADAVKWRKEHQCATCHHGAMTLWTLAEANRQGYAVRNEVLADLVSWNKTQFVHRFDQAKDLRPGYNVMPLALATFLSAAEGKLPGVTPEEINELEEHFTRRQDDDGSWLPPPPANGPVPVFESREVLTLRAYLALERYLPADAKKPSPARTSRQKAATWLGKIRPGDTTQVAALRLLLEARAGRSTDSLRTEIDRLLGRQKADGGWGQIEDLPSDAFATGQALYALGTAGVSREGPEVRRAVAFLLASQREDGSWPMTPRATPERKASRNTVPIIYFGSAWATLGLVRSLPKP